MNPDYISIYVTSNDLGQRIDVYLSEKIEQPSAVFLGTDEHPEISINKKNIMIFFERITPHL